jgi:hypothetical protein
MSFGWVVDALVILGGLSGWVAAYFSWRQWQKTNRKIAMLQNASAAAEVLPAWYTTRMMQDHWLFGLFTATGQMVAIKQIKAISDDGLWMDVELAQKDETDPFAAIYKVPVIHASGTDRTTASIQIDTIVAAIDLWST